MELSQLSQAMRQQPVRRDFFDEAMKRIDRVFVREDFTQTEPDADTLLRQSDLAIEEIGRLGELEEKIQYLRENIDSMSDAEIVNYLNRIEPVFSDSEVVLATESMTVKVRTRAQLVCEDMDSRVKWTMIALVITALLKAIGWLIEIFVAKGKENGKRGKKNKPSGLDKDQQRTEEEIRELAKEKAAEHVARKYAINMEIVREQMMRLYNYPSEGNLRQPGGKGAGAAAEVASLIIDEVNALNLNTSEKERVRDGAFKCIFGLLDNNVPLGHFAFNETTRKILAKDFVEFSQNGFKGPISRMMSVMANLLPDKESAYQIWYKEKTFLNNEVRLMSAGVGEDLLAYLDSMEYASRDLERFFNHRGQSNSFDYDAATRATESSLPLNSLISFKDDAQYQSLVNHVTSHLRDCSFTPTTTAAISTPMCFSPEVRLEKVKTEKGVYYDFPENGGPKFVNQDAYRAIISWLNSLSGEDAIATFARWFYQHHGDYDKNDTIEKRLHYLTYGYSMNRREVKTQLNTLKGNFEKLLELSKTMSKSRASSPSPTTNRLGQAMFIYDIEIPFFGATISLNDGRRTDNNLTRPLGKRVESLCKTYRESLKGWSALMMTVENYDKLASKINIER